MKNNIDNLFFSYALIATLVVTIFLIFIIKNPIIVLIIGLSFVFTTVIFSVLYIEFLTENKKQNYLNNEMVEELEDQESCKRKLTFTTIEEIEDYFFGEENKNG